MKVSALYRHPLKAHGREALQSITLQAGQSMPFDRRWAVAHDAARLAPGEWAACRNFSRGAKAPALMAIDAELDVENNLLSLRHPDLPDLTFDPDGDCAAFLSWVKPLVPSERAQPQRIVQLEERGFTDTDYPSISLCNGASHAAVADQAGTALSPLRWRGNIWFDGADAWEEADWTGREIHVGSVVMRVRAPIIRCLATTANPQTGKRDVDTLSILETICSAKTFGVYAEIIEGGKIALGDTLEVT